MKERKSLVKRLERAIMESSQVELKNSQYKLGDMAPVKRFTEYVEMQTARRMLIRLLTAKDMEAELRHLAAFYLEVD